MMRSSILGASTMLNVLIQHLPLQSLFWTKIWRAFRASDPSSKTLVDAHVPCSTNEKELRAIVFTLEKFILIMPLCNSF